jgi:anti-sigma regulatory factor (Ser/Thr protein kinase)
MVKVLIKYAEIVYYIVEQPIIWHMLKTMTYIIEYFGGELLEMKDTNELELLNVGQTIRIKEIFGKKKKVVPVNIFNLQLIIEEIVTNVIKYGRQTGNEIICIEAEAKTDGIVLTIKDNSAPFNPLEARLSDTTLSADKRDIGGLGLVLVRKKAKSIEYEYEEGWNVVNVLI